MFKRLNKTYQNTTSHVLNEGGLKFFKLKPERLRKNKKQFIFLFFTFYFVLESKAQCAMCRAVLESEEGQTTAEGVNDGIMYLMIIPYLLVAGLSFMIYWKFFRKKKEV